MYCTLYNNFFSPALKDFIFLLEVKIANKSFQNAHQRQGLNAIRTTRIFVFEITIEEKEII